MTWHSGVVVMTNVFVLGLSSIFQGTGKIHQIIKSQTPLF